MRPGTSGLRSARNYSPSSSARASSRSSDSSCPPEQGFEEVHADAACSISTPLLVQLRLPALEVDCSLAVEVQLLGSEGSQRLRETLTALSQQLKDVCVDSSLVDESAQIGDIAAQAKRQMEDWTRRIQRKTAERVRNDANEEISRIRAKCMREIAQLREVAFQTDRAVAQGLPRPEHRVSLVAAGDFKLNAVGVRNGDNNEQHLREGYADENVAKSARRQSEGLRDEEELRYHIEELLRKIQDAYQSKVNLARRFHAEMSTRDIHEHLLLVLDRIEKSRFCCLSSGSCGCTRRPPCHRSTNTDPIENAGQAMVTGSSCSQNDECTRTSQSLADASTQYEMLLQPEGPLLVDASSQCEMHLPHQGACMELQVKEQTSSTGLNVCCQCDGPVRISRHFSDASTQFESLLRNQGTSTDMIDVMPDMMPDMVSDMFSRAMPTKRSRGTCTETCQKQDQATCTEAADMSFLPSSEPSQVQGQDTRIETSQQKVALVEAAVQCNIIADALCGWEPDCPEAWSPTGCREEGDSASLPTRPEEDFFSAPSGYTSFVRASSAGDAQPASGNNWHKMREAVNSGSWQMLGEAVTSPSIARLPQLPSRGNILRSKRAPRDKDKAKEQLKPDDFPMVEDEPTSSLLKEPAATDEPETTLQALSLKVAQSDPTRPSRLNMPLRRHSYSANLGQQDEDYRPPLPKIGESHEPSGDCETLDLQDGPCLVQPTPVSPSSATGRVLEASEVKSAVARRRSVPAPGLRIEVTAPTSWAPGTQSQDIDRSTQNSPCSSKGSPRSPRLSDVKKPTALQPQARTVSMELPTVKASPATQAQRRSSTSMELHNAPRIDTAGLDTAHEPREPASPSVARQLSPNGNAQLSPRTRKSFLKFQTG